MLHTLLRITRMGRVTRVTDEGSWHISGSTQHRAREARGARVVTFHQQFSALNSDNNKKSVAPCWEETPLQRPYLINTIYTLDINFSFEICIYLTFSWLVANGKLWLVVGGKDWSVLALNPHHSPFVPNTTQHCSVPLPPRNIAKYQHHTTLPHFHCHCHCTTQSTQHNITLHNTTQHNIT